MRRPTDLARDPGSLLNRRTGTSATHTLKRLGRSPAGRVERLERSDELLRRTLAFHLKIPLGFMLKDDRHLVDFGPTGRTGLWSSDDSVTIERNPAGQSEWIDFRAAGGGCTEVVKTVCAQTGSTFTAEDCSGHIGHVGENTTALRVIPDGVAGSPHLFNHKARLTPQVALEGINLTHLGFVIGDDGNLYRFELEQVSTESPPPNSCGSS